MALKYFRKDKGIETVKEIPKPQFITKTSCNCTYCSTDKVMERSSTEVYEFKCSKCNSEYYFELE